MVKLLIKLEGLSAFLTALYFYYQLHLSWLLFLLLLIVPDISMLGYLKNKRLGTLLYNLVHSYLLNLGLVVYGLSTGNSLILSVGLIFTAHISADRFFGFGLKYPSSFKDTHIQRL